MAIATMYLSLLNEADDVVSRVKVAAHDGLEQFARLALGGHILINGTRHEVLDKIDGDGPELFVKPLMAQSPPIRYQ